MQIIRTQQGLESTTESVEYVLTETENLGASNAIMVGQMICGPLRGVYYSSHEKDPYAIYTPFGATFKGDSTDPNNFFTTKLIGIGPIEATQEQEIIGVRLVSKDKFFLQQEFETTVFASDNGTSAIFTRIIPTSKTETPINVIIYVDERGRVTNVQSDQELETETNLSAIYAKINQLRESENHDEICERRGIAGKALEILAEAFNFEPWASEFEERNDLIAQVALLKEEKSKLEVTARQQAGVIAGLKDRITLLENTTL